MSSNRSFTAPRLILSMIVMLLMVLIVPQGTRAFSPDTYTWSSPNLTYTIDSSFSALGSNYVTALNDAISDWNSSATPVSFTYNSSSPNRIQAGDIGTALGQVPEQRSHNQDQSSIPQEQIFVLIRLD